ncbi:glycerophosphodiester phosphodiesterase [candidate division KSB1 bacterium]|nr:glycerophosphodiester phosphodiesterase [candidate division KSB1 bacterium]
MCICLCLAVAISGCKKLDPPASAKIVIAHRGASGYLPEHTAPAVVMAVAMGAHYIEQDIALSRDNRAIVIHDIHLDAVTDVARIFPGRHRSDGRYYVADFTWQEIQKLTAHERIDLASGAAAFSGRFPLTGDLPFKLMTFEQELQLIRGLEKSLGRRIGLCPEIKSPEFHRRQGMDAVGLVLDILDAHGYREKSDPVLLQCFEFDALVDARRRFGTRLQLLQLIGADSSRYGWMVTDAGLDSLAQVCDAIGPDWRRLAELKDGEWRDRGLVARAHERGLRVFPYTVRDDVLPKGMADAASWYRLLYRRCNADGLFSDFPDRAVHFAKRASARR